VVDFLKLNGIPIPVADRKATFSTEEFGSRQRAMDSSLRSTRTGVKRIWRFETPVLDPETALMVVGLLAGTGHRFSFDVDAFDFKGYGPLDPTLTQAYTMRPGAIPSRAQPAEYGMKYGGAVAVEDGTINLFPQNVRTGTDTLSNTTGFTAIDGATLLSTDVPALGVGRVALQGVRVLDVGVAAGVGGVRGGVKTNAVAGVASTTYTASVYVQASAAVRCQLKDVTTGNNGTIESVSPQSLGADIGETKWVRISSTVTTGGGGGAKNLEFEVLEDVADTAPQIYCDEFQLEAKPGPTSWYDGTRAAGLLKMDVQSFVDTGRVIAEDIRVGVDLTAMMWVNRGADRFLTNRAFFWMAERDGLSSDLFYGNCLGVEHTNLGGNNFNIEVYAGGSPTGAPAASPLAVAVSWAMNTWAHLAVVIRRDAKFGTDANQLKLYWDGDLVAESLWTGAGELLPDLSQLRALFVGTRGQYAAGPRRNNGGLIDDLVIVPYAMTAAGIAEIAGYDRGFSDLPRLEANGLAVVAPPQVVVVQGELPSGEFVQVQLEGTWTPNMRSVVMELIEV